MFLPPAELADQNLRTLSPRHNPDHGNPHDPVRSNTTYAHPGDPRLTRRDPHLRRATPTTAHLLEIFTRVFFSFFRYHGTRHTPPPHQSGQRMMRGGGDMMVKARKSTATAPGFTPHWLLSYCL